MKAEILKIAGVKSEKEFYKKFPTEESFMKVHGKAFKKAQVGAMIQGSASPQFNPQPINFQQLYDQNDMFITGSTQDMRNKQAQDQASLAAQQKMANKKSGFADAIGQIGKIAGDVSGGAKNGKKLKKAKIGDVINTVGKGLGKGVDKLGGPMAAAQAVGDVVGGIQQMRDEKQIMNQAQQMAGVSDVALQASMTRPEQVQKRYVRPEDNLNTGQEFFPIYGVGTTLAKNGTEIANTFAPNTIYTDLEEAQDGVTAYMKKKMQDAKDATIAKDYNLPEVVVEAIPITQWNDPDKPSGYPQYTPKPGDNVNSPGWDIAEFYKSWVSSPEYERRMKNTGYYDAGTDKFYAKNLKKDIRISYDQYLKNQREGRMGALESTQEPGFIQIEPALYMGRPASRYTGLGIDIHPEHTKTPEMFETTLAHEIGHAIDSTTNFEDSLITSSMLPWSEFNKPFYSGVDPVSGNPIITQKDDIRREQAKHVRNAPQEFKSDLQALRYLMYDRGVYDIRKGKKFTKEDLERAKEKLKGNQSLERTIQAAGENGLIKLMNIIAKGKEDVIPVAMGGMSIPGSVGFTYARTAGSAPSEGKYAKKTMASAQNGQEMKFYQNGLDWKPKSMQEGGKIYEGQELPEFVVEGKDERMREAMFQGMAKFYGHVGELMGAPQKEAMQLITGKEQTPSEAWGFQKPGGWLDSYSSFGKNALNFGMDALGDPLNAVPGVGLADDVFKLSVKNVGKNLTENLGKGIGKRAISQAPSPQMMADNVAASATPNASTVANQQPLYTELTHPHMDLLQELKQKTIDRLDTPEGRRRLQYMINKNFKIGNHEAWGKPVEGWGEFFLHGLKSGELSGYKKLTPEDIIEDFRNLKFVESSDPFIGKDNAYASRLGGDAGFGPGSFPVMYMGENQIPGDIMRIFDHEIGHHLQRVKKPTNLDNQLSKLELKKQPNLPNLASSEEMLEDVDFSNTNQKWGYGFYPALDYFIQGTGGMEKLPFAAEIRQSLLRRGKIKDYYDEITPQMIEDHYDLYNKTGGNKSILRLYEIMEKTPKNFKILSETLNKLPAVTLPIAGGAAATISALQNNQPVQKQKNGGITKDNQGYWNPNNWGQPVEIGSNNITMQGVYEPLLGISDTGDTKLMQPGKNYKFKGKKVTEYPVAELGINQLDAQPMKKLNQLLNFTNNPDKDNWLDKYN